MVINNSQLVVGRDNYERKERIGRGSYGQVYKGVRNGTCEFVAMKYIDDVKSRKEDLAKEAKILSNVMHPNILEMLDSFDTQDGFVIVTELAQGSLSEVLNNGKGLSEEEVQKIAKQLVPALHYLHSQRIVHRDMKPQNILVFPGNVVKIGDFGLARMMPPNITDLDSLKGTPVYMAPEQIGGERYNHTADLWSLGLILYQLFHGKLPFEANSFLEYQLMRQKGKDSIRYSHNMSSNFKDFLRGLLEIVPDKRLDGPNLLAHPFLSGHYSQKEEKEKTNILNLRIKEKEFTAGSKVGDVAQKIKSHRLTLGLISAKPEGFQLLDWLENKSLIDAKLIAQDGAALSAILQPLKNFDRDKDVLTLKQSLNIISNIVDAGAISSPTMINEMLWPVIGCIKHLINIKASDYNGMLEKGFRAVKKLLIYYGTLFGKDSSSHWIAIVDLFKEVAGCTEEVASGEVLYQSIGCITAIVHAPLASQDSLKKMLDYAKDNRLEDTLLLCLESYGTSLISGSKFFLDATKEACRAIWSLLSTSETQYALKFPLSSMYSHSSDGLDKPTDDSYCGIIAAAATNQLLQSKATQVAFDRCLSQPVTDVCFSAIQIILRCCLHANSVTAVLCGFPSSLHVTTNISGGGDHTIISTIFSILSVHASHERVPNGKPDNSDGLIRCLCLVLATAAQSLKSVGRNSALLILTSLPEIQRTRLTDLAKLYSRMPNSRPYVMLAQASIISLESSTSSISEIALPLIPESTTLCGYLGDISDRTGNKLSMWHGFRDGAVGLLEARLKWDRDSTIQQLCDSGFPKAIIDVLRNYNQSTQTHIGLSPIGVVSAVSLLFHCLTDDSSTSRQLLCTVECVKLMSRLISDVHLDLVRCSGGPGGSISGVRDTVNAVINLLEFPFVALKNRTHSDIEANPEEYIVILLKVGVLRKIVGCIEDMELEDVVRPVACLASMIQHRTLAVEILRTRLLDPVTVNRLLGASSPSKVTFSILRIFSDLAKMDKEFYEHIERADILPFLNKVLTHEDHNMREEACYAISQMCWHSDYFYHILAKQKIISLLVRCYSDPDKQVRYNASFAIFNATYHNDLLHKELRRCIPQVAKDLRLSTKKKYRKLVENACYILRHLVHNSDKFCKEIISKGAMEALLKLVAGCTSEPCNPHEEDSKLLDISLKTLAALCKHSPCIQLLHSSVCYSEIKQFCQTSELPGAASVLRILNKTVNRKSDLAEG